MENKLLLALMQRVLDVEGDDAEVSLCCIADASNIPLALIQSVYDEIFMPGCSVRDVADARAIQLGYEGIDDLIAYGKRSAVVFEG